MNFGFYTLGCKVNQYETQAMEQLLAKMGHSILPFDADCDAYIINTCSVTAVADKKNRNVIRKCRKAHPGAVIGVCGCYPQHAAQALAELPVDVLGGSNGRHAFLDAMLLCLKTRQKQTVLDNALRRRSFEVLPAGSLEGRTRAMLKVQDGCVNFCTYCIIPYTRGPIRSAPISLAVEQAAALQQQGYRELVITGIEIASWGADLPGKPGLGELLTAVSQAVPGLRIRLGSLEPRIITEDFCKLLTQLPNLCPHFHLSMQSGCDSVLARMGRKYDTARYLQSVTLLKSAFPGCAITTDMIVGFPGETEEEFKKSLAFLERCGFADMHIFPYSRRPGTPAAKMPEQLANAIKEARSAQAACVAQKLSHSYRSQLIGTTQQVLFEQPEGSCFTGHTPSGVKVYVKAATLHNTVKPVCITGVYLDGVQGKITEE